ncbi:MAG: hypothetical protein KIS67_00275 [Verrucomicrobiae bacterium]|nr:hypothetical protein [Verrucomicrobiae bacterium]
MITPELKDTLEALSYFATIIGIPVAIVVFLLEKKKDRLQHERETYIEANGRYIDYLTMCLEHPELDCSEFTKDDPDLEKADMDVKKLTAFTVLISLLETGYVLYRDQHTSARSTQWRGWHDYMVTWSRRPDFRRAWPILGPQFDSDFVQHMEKILRETDTETKA